MIKKFWINKEKQKYRIRNLINKDELSRHRKWFQDFGVIFFFFRFPDENLSLTAEVVSAGKSWAGKSSGFEVLRFGKTKVR